MLFFGVDALAGGISLSGWTLVAFGIVLIVPFLLFTFAIIGAGSHLIELCFSLLMAWFDQGKRAARRLEIILRQAEEMALRKAKNV
ncbi:MAG: hypothetical protein JKY00_03820 [Roseicyclus sp.]|nr:hypothetical protein [Roseicyclus sp.]